MRKIKLISDLWNAKQGDEIEVSFIRAEWAIKKGKAVEVEQVKAKAENTDYQNKSEKAPKKRK